MLRERQAEKAERLLVEGRVSILRVTDDEIQAVVRGDHGSYYVAWHDGGLWTCSCPANGLCSHARAVRQTVAVDLAR